MCLCVLYVFARVFVCVVLCVWLNGRVFGCVVVHVCGYMCDWCLIVSGVWRGCLCVCLFLRVCMFIYLCARVRCLCFTCLCG